MYMPPTRSGAGNVIDQVIQRMQHQWETDKAYRARMSGVIAIVSLLFLVACVVLISFTASGVLASVGIGGSGNRSNDPNLNTGVQIVNGAPTFPTPSLPPLTSGGVPSAQPIPSSQTPVPGPTAAPTATPYPTATGGGGGGPLPTTCNGGGGGKSWNIAPCPLTHGQHGTLTIVDRAHAGTAINVILSFGVCTGGVSCTLLWPPNGPNAVYLDGSGVANVGFTVPAQAEPNKAAVTGTAGSQSIMAAPVQ